MAVSIESERTGKHINPLASAKSHAARLPDILVEAKQIAQSTMAGWHGRRRAGTGDVFWQFRAYDQSESSHRIDWRRSARDDSMTVRDQEWQAAMKFWVWADNSPSMDFASKEAMASKRHRALVIVLALAEILARSGERVGWPGLTKSVASRKSAENICARLEVDETNDSLPPIDEIGNSCQFIMAGDFLMPLEEVKIMINNLARRGIRGMVIHVIDPAEENFPYAGRTEFHDVEGNNKLTFGRAQSVKNDYVKIFNEHKQAIKEICKNARWLHMTHHTHKRVQMTLTKAHTMLQESPIR